VYLVWSLDLVSLFLTTRVQIRKWPITIKIIYIIRTWPGWSVFHSNHCKLWQLSFLYLEWLWTLMCILNKKFSHSFHSHATKTFQNNFVSIKFTLTITNYNCNIKYVWSFKYINNYLTFKVAKLFCTLKTSTSHIQ
jgi:hypothetical protein